MCDFVLTVFNGLRMRINNRFCQNTFFVLKTTQKIRPNQQTKRYFSTCWKNFTNQIQTQQPSQASKQNKTNFIPTHSVCVLNHPVENSFLGSLFIFSFSVMIATQELVNRK